MRFRIFLAILLWASIITGCFCHDKNKRKSRCTMMHTLEQNLTSLWDKVHTLSIPLHVHVHDVHGGVSHITPTHPMGEEPMNVAEGEAKEEEEKMMSPSILNPVHHHKHKREKEAAKRREMAEKRRLERDEEEEEEEGGSSEGDSSEEHKHHGKGGTHIHIHLNMGGQAMNATDEKHMHMGHAVHAYPEGEYIYARCDMLRNSAFLTSHNVRGALLMRQRPNENMEVKVDLSGFDVITSRGLPPEKVGHGLHVHEYGDFSNGCDSTGSHYNPLGTVHGSPSSEVRHPGDWGNLVPDYRGAVVKSFQDKNATLMGPLSMLGRSVVVHERADDLGKGGTPASLKTGDAGGRIACCFISRYDGKNW